MSYTLWDKWTGKSRPQAPRPEDAIGNLLGLYTADYVDVKIFGGDSGTYEVEEVREYIRRIGGGNFSFNDYFLMLGEKRAVLRAIPKEGADHPDLLFLTVFFESEFDENIRNAVGYDDFKVNEGTDDEAVFTALGAGTDGYLATIRKVGKDDRRKTLQTRYWDYSRPGNPKFDEVESDTIFFFVEIDEENGYITMYKGTNISAHDVKVLPAGQPQTTK